MLAAARAKPAASVAPAAAAPKVAPAAVEAKVSPKPAAAAKPAAEKPAVVGAKDTASILAAARTGVKPGPMSKEEAAKSGKEIKVTQSKVTVPPMPVKPEAAKPPAPKAKTDEERRGFMQLLFGSFLAVGFTAMASTFSLWTLGFARFMFPNILTEPPSKFKVGFPNDFPPGKVEEKFKALFGVWVVNTEYAGKREIVALRTVCTHLGCTPNWLEGEQKFKCPCHGSGFYKDGINFEGPAPRPLERYSIRLADDGQIEVDKSKLFQEELGQWADPACYVSV
jgi:cytochrome b6-f complex iron-sulfur subunit